MFTVTWIPAAQRAGGPHGRRNFPGPRGDSRGGRGGGGHRAGRVESRAGDSPLPRRSWPASPSEMAGNAKAPFSPQWDDRTDIILRGESAIASQQQIIRPSFRLPLSLDQYGKDIIAQKGDLQGSPGRAGRAGYLFVGIEFPKDLDKQPSLKLDGRPVIVTAKDAPDWLGPDQCFVVSRRELRAAHQRQGMGASTRPRPS